MVLRDGKATAGAEEEEESSRQQEGTASCGDQMEDRVAGLEAQLNEVRAMLQTLVGRSVQNIPVAPESAPMRAAVPEFQQAPTVDVQSVRGSLPLIPEHDDASFVQRPGKEPAGTSAPVGGMDIQSRQPQSTEATNVLWGNMRLEAKIEIPEYRGELDGEKLDVWLDKLESYFALYGFNDIQRLTFVRVKMESRALIWWNAYVQSRGFQNLSWDGFKELVRKQFYPVGYRESRWRKWLFLK